MLERGRGAASFRACTRGCRFPREAASAARCCERPRPSLRRWCGRPGRCGRGCEWACKLAPACAGNRAHTQRRVLRFVVGRVPAGRRGGAAAQSSHTALPGPAGAGRACADMMQSTSRVDPRTLTPVRPCTWRTRSPAANGSRAVIFPSQRGKSSCSVALSAGSSALARTVLPWRRHRRRASRRLRASVCKRRTSGASSLSFRSMVASAIER